MKKILVFVMSLDGKITHWKDHRVKSWSSEEDEEYFKKTWNEASVIVLGSGTYDVNPTVASSDHRVIIMTRDPERYEDREVPGQLEFTDMSPKDLVARYENKGLKQMLVGGGAHIATSFLKNKLIDEVWITIEPKIIGAGSNFVIDEKLDVEMKLLNHQKVNGQGTLIAKYSIKSD